MSESSNNTGGHRETNATGNNARSSALAKEIERRLLDPEFVDCKGLESLFGIRRSLAYQLLADGVIKGVSLKRRGQLRGKRLWAVDSVRNFLAKQMEGGVK